MLFGLPYVLIAILWGRLRRLEDKLERTLTWANTLARSQAQVASRAAVAVEPEPQPEPEPETEPQIEPEQVVEPTPAPQPVSVPYTAASADEPETATMGPHQPDDLELDGEAAPRFHFDFEDIFGRRLPIWAGGIALAIGGIFLVRYSIEAGLITPLIRVVLSFAFGLGLIGAAEAAFRLEHKIEDERVRQALAGAGIATLFGAFYLAGTSYGLIGATAAFIGLAAVTAAAIALSFRFGLPCAILGLVGGFAAPVLVDSDSSNVPLLALYLALVTGGLAWTGEKQGHRWIGYVALGVGLGWGVLLQVLGLGSESDLAALGIYLVVLGSALPAFLATRGGPNALQIAAGGIATLQMGVLVANAGFAPLTLCLYLLIGAALAALGWRFERLRAGSAIAALVGLWLLGLWPEPAPAFFAVVAAAMAAIFAGVPLLLQWLGKASLLERAQIAGMALGIGATSYLQFGNWDAISGPLPLAAAIGALAILPLAAFAARWRQAKAFAPRDDSPLLASGHLLLLLAGLMIAPAWTAPIIAAALALATLALLWQRKDRVLERAGESAIAVALLALLVTPGFQIEAPRLGGVGSSTPDALAALRWIAVGLPLLAMGALRTAIAPRALADGLAAALAYGAIAQLAPWEPLAWLAAIGAFIIATWREPRAGAWGALLTIAGVWALTPVGLWCAAGVAALAGQPFFASDAIAPLDLTLRVAPFALVALAIAMRAKLLPKRVSMAMVAAASTLGIIGLHSLYKLGWSINSMLRFEWYGMAERTIWQALLLGAALVIAKVVKSGLAQPLRIGLIAASLLHFAWFTLILHNPLYAVQHVGPTPLANWLPATYGLAIAALVLLRDDCAAWHRRARQALDVAVMVLITLLAISLLRQVFAGSVPSSTLIGATESLLLSLLGIALALGFLWWGSFKQERIWRIGSLVLMLGAVLKVFLVDAAGLSGLLRIASFMALGFSLIGIGWVYSRQLRKRAA